MRVVIITVYNSQNSGSMLQACTLYETVRELGYEVAFLNTHARNLLFDTIKYCGKRILLLKFTQIATQWRVYREFKNFLSPYNIITEKDLDFANDIFILGSDEIWNVRRAEMREYSIFWGSGLPNDRIIAYAPTVNNSRAEDLVKYQMVRNAMENISALSVRDSYSKNVLQKIFKRDIAVVCDPTHLWNRVKYNKWILKVKCVPYILVYGKTNSYSSESIAAIKNFAKEKHLKIISYMFAFSWVDATVRGGVNGFLSYVDKASFVIGSSFHIVAFSLLFHKKFICVGANNTKVMELLLQYNLESRLRDEIDNVFLEENYVREINYDIIDNKMEIMREQSIQYLKDSLRTVSNRL